MPQSDNYCYSPLNRFSQANPLDMQNKFPEDKGINDIPSTDSIYETILDPPPPPPLPQPLSLVEKSAAQPPVNIVNFRPSNPYQMPVQSGKSETSAVAENVSLPCTGPPVTHPESYNKQQHGACPALGTDYDEEVPPDYSSLQVVDTQLNSSSGDRASTCSSYQDMMAPENLETGYATVENKNHGSQLDTDPKGDVKEESGYQELLLAMKEPDGEYARPNVQP